MVRREFSEFSWRFYQVFFYGINFDPPQYILDHTVGTTGIDMAFSHFCGILFTSNLVMIIYCIYKKNKPALYPEAVLPAMVSGLLWAIAQSSFFIANENLELVISFPIISTGPGLVASLWGVFVFGEIKGTRNFIFLSLGFMVVISSVVMIALSKT